MRKLIWAVLGLALAAGAVWSLWPQPQQVDLAPVSRGPMQGTLSAQGTTRVRAPFAIAAPIAGTADRSPVEVGDRVSAGETVVAILRPADPTLMDARSRAQAEAAVAEAEAAVALAETGLRQAEGALEHAATRLERTRALVDRGVVPRRMLDDFEAAHDAALQGRLAALSQLDLSHATLGRAQAQFMGPQGIADPAVPPGECCLRLVSPLDGVVLALADRSARPVQPGSPLLTVGNLDEMDVEIDLLSADAVQVPPGARAEIDRWGGPATLEARLRRIDPAAFTRVSALGIEEQRVRLHLDLLTPPAGRPGLGDGFRVQVRLILWEADGLLRVPQAALFRQGGGWAVFRAQDGRAVQVPVQIGRMAGDVAEVLSGLAEGERVILFPAATLAEGARIAPRAP